MKIKNPELAIEEFDYGRWDEDLEEESGIISNWNKESDEEISDS
ncbi:35806_t:CDS:2, partial [Gigaspora margarita]